MPRPTASPPDLRGFTFVKPLGSGGFSDVYLYEQELPRRRVAVKVLLTEGLTAASREAFVAEANVMAQLSAHPYIVSIHHADVAPDGRPYFIMEYCSGPSLGDRYKQKPLSVVEALRTGVRLSSAIATAHSAGILHRDIKPANVLTNDYGWPALTDFGISSAVESDDLPLHTVTRETVADSGATTGSQSVGMSIPWSPPEMFDDEPRPDVRSDVFSLAATIYTLLAGRTPFEVAGRSNGALDLMGRIERGDITPLDRTDVPPTLLAVLKKGMSVDRTQRFATAVDFARALQRVEMELNYAPTPIDVPNLVVPDVPIDRSADDDATRARAVRTIPAQAPAPVAAPSAAIEAPGVAVAESTVLRGPTADDTVVRRPAEVQTEVVRVEPTRRRSGAFIVIVLASVVVVGGGAAALAAVIGSQPAQPGAHQVATAPGAGTSSNDEVFGSVVPSPVLVSAATMPDGSAEFEWQVESAEDGDRFRWQQVSGGSATGGPSVDARAVVASSETGAPVCIQIWTVRQGAQSAVALEACAP